MRTQSWTESEQKKNLRKNTERNKGTPVTYGDFDMKFIPKVFPNCHGPFWRYRKYAFLCMDSFICVSPITIQDLLHVCLSFWRGQNLPRGTMLRILSEFLPTLDRIAVPPDQKLSKIYKLVICQPLCYILAPAKNSSFTF